MSPNTNPNDERELEWEVNGYKPPFTQGQVRKALSVAIKKLQEESYYAPLIERYPILVDEQVPVKQQNGIRDHESCACTDSNNVYVMTSEIAKKFNLIDTTFKNKNLDRNLANNIASILAHEYTHVLCQHMKVQRSMGKMTKAEAHCYELACEVEANRGHMVEFGDNDWDKRRTMVYEASITDDVIPETKKDKYLPQIYATILNLYNKQRQKFEQLLQELINKDLIDVVNGKGQGKGKSKGNESKNKNREGEKNKGQVQGQPQGDKDKGDMDGDDTTHGLGVDGDDDDKDKNESEWEELTQEKIEKSIMDMKQTVDKVRSQTVGDETGIGLESPYTEYQPELTPQENLKVNYERWHEKQVKKELAKLKGLIRGNISKNREKTYARPTRRPIIGSGGLIKKGVRYEKSYSPKVLIAMDSSGSMQSTTMKEVACAIENIFKDLGKPKQGSYICKHESNVSDVRPMRQWKEVVESYYPSGGNCFVRVVEKANELGVDVVLNIGDGQDTVTRNYYEKGKQATKKFVADGRQWFDVLVTNKNENRYYKEESYYDETNGFHREGIYLGDKISKYLNK